MARSSPNLLNRRFGRLVAIKKIPYLGPRPTSRTMWLCKCSCGKQTTALACDLTSGKKRSCWCLRALASKNNIRAAINKIRVLESKEERQINSWLSTFIRHRQYPQTKQRQLFLQRRNYRAYYKKNRSKLLERAKRSRIIYKEKIRLREKKYLQSESYKNYHKKTSRAYYLKNRDQIKKKAFNKKYGDFSEMALISDQINKILGQQKNNRSKERGGKNVTGK